MAGRSLVACLSSFWSQVMRGVLWRWAVAHKLLYMYIEMIYTYAHA